MDSEILKRVAEHMADVPPTRAGMSAHLSPGAKHQAMGVQRAMTLLDAAGVPPSEVERIGWFAVRSAAPLDAIRVIASRYWRGDFSPIEDMQQTYEYERYVHGCPDSTR